MAQLDEVKEFIAINKGIEKLNMMFTEEIRNSFQKNTFLAEIFSTPGSNVMHFGFTYKYNILYKKEIHIVDGMVEFGEKMVIISEKYAKIIREQFDENLFEEILPHIDVDKVKYIQSLVDRRYIMRKAQKMSRNSD